MSGSTIIVSLYSSLRTNETSPVQIELNSPKNMLTLKKFTKEQMLEHVCKISGADHKLLKKKVNIGLRTTEGNVYYFCLSTLGRGTFNSMQTTFPGGRLVQVNPKFVSS